jgi:spore germination protein KB
MNTSERISTGQVIAVVVVSRLSFTLIYFGANPVVRQDVWWQNVPDALLTILVAWLLNRLWQRFPDKTLVQVMRQVLGRAIGSAMALVLVLVLVLGASLMLRIAGEVLTIVSLPQTPTLVVMACLAAVAAWCARHGVEVLGRCAEVIFPIIAGTVFLTFLFLLPYLRFERLLPFEILTVGPLPHIKSMVGVVARTTELIWVGVVVPSVKGRERLFRAWVFAESWLALLWVIMSISIFGVLGGHIEAFPFPWIMAIRAVEVLEFMERIDGLVLAVWVLGMFVRIAVLLWTASASLSQALGVRNYRVVVLPLTLLAITYAEGQAESLSQLLHMTRPEVLTPYLLTFVLLIPMGLLLLAALRGLGGAATKGME